MRALHATVGRGRRRVTQRGSHRRRGMYVHEIGFAHARDELGTVVAVGCGLPRGPRGPPGTYALPAGGLLLPRAQIKLRI